jgi:hypothetical protein
MLTHDECIAKAMEMEVRALLYPEDRADYMQLARNWQWIAMHAEWQGEFEKRYPHKPS